MLQITPQMRILVAIQPADFRCGIDGRARVCIEPRNYSHESSKFLVTISTHSTNVRWQNSFSTATARRSIW